MNVGTNVQFVVTPSGPAAPTSYQWRSNGVNLANSAHFAGVTTSTLTITNVQLSDIATYSVVVTNAAGSVTPSATLTVISTSQPTLSTVALVGTNAILSFTTPDGSDGIGSFTLQSSVVVQGPYTDTPSTITGASGTFQVTVPLTTNDTMFYRLKRN
ncbi:MAG: immunoglobulin domain-containing protein [Limisphaerales bacterium]